MKNIGVDWDKVHKYIEENIYTLPGIVNHKDELTVVLTGSRAFGCFSDTSDVDIDVICSTENFKLIQKEMFERGKTSNKFTKIIDKFKGYPKDILEKKIKYRYLLANYWLIDGYPHNHSRDEELFSATLSLLNGINELYRFFYLVEGKPYPYTEKLSTLVIETKLGKKYKTFLNEIIDLAIGRGVENQNIWERLDEAIELILYGDISKKSEDFFNDCDNALLEAGIDKVWVKAGYDNIDELLYGKLGQIP